MQNKTIGIPAGIPDKIHVDPELDPKLACHVVNSNIAIGSLPTLQTSHGLLALFEKIYYGEPIFTDFSISGRMYNTVVSIKCMM
jgi:hypothetical protein